MQFLSVVLSNTDLVFLHTYSYVHFCRAFDSPCPYGERLFMKTIHHNILLFHFYNYLHKKEINEILTMYNSERNQSSSV